MVLLDQHGDGVAEECNGCQEQYDCDETDVDGCTAQDAIAVCQTDAELTGSKFHLTGTASCYKGTTFTFEGLLPEAGADGVTVPVRWPPAPPPPDPPE